MTTQVASRVTLDEVRARFSQAESNLTELGDSLVVLRSSSERFDEAGGKLDSANARLFELADQLEAATRGITTSVELVRQGMAVLEKSDPARVLGELDRVGTVVDKSAEASQNSIDALKNSLSSIAREERETLTTSLAARIDTLHSFMEEIGGRAASQMEASRNTVRESFTGQLAELSEVRTAIGGDIGALQKDVSTQIGYTLEHVTTLLTTHFASVSDSIIQVNEHNKARETALHSVLREISESQATSLRERAVQFARAQASRRHLLMASAGLGTIVVLLQTWLLLR